MKDGRTHLAHKAEHAVDLSSGAIVAITLQAADLGDTTTIGITLQEAQSNVALINERSIEELVADKGYHSNEVLVDLHADGVRSYIPEPERGSRNWDGKEKEQKQVYGNRRRMRGRGRRGKDLQKLRTELTERSFAHMYETGGMRRTHLKGQKNILKRLLFHAVGFNLALLVRKSSGIGKPRTLQGLSDTILLVQIAMTAWTARWNELAGENEPISGSFSLWSGFSSSQPQLKVFALLPRAVRGFAGGLEVFQEDGNMTGRNVFRNLDRTTIQLSMFVLCCSLCAGTAWADGAVYAMTNALGNNQILVYHRASNGSLSSTPIQTIATGGGGSGLQLAGVDSLGSAGSVQLDEAHQLLFVVNTESASANNGAGTYNQDCSLGTITSFLVASDGTLTFADRVFSGGLFPNSLTVKT